MTALEVEHIIVFGHRGCGGIKALLTADPNLPQNAFIHNWMNIADEARRRTLVRIAHDQPFELQLPTLGQESMKTSLANLLSLSVDP